MPDRRRAPRVRTLQGAQIADRQDGAPIGCVVRNLSATGACLLVVSHDRVPDSFDLVLNRDKTRYPCRVLWRTANQVGVEFQVAASPASHASRVGRQAEEPRRTARPGTHSPTLHLDVGIGDERRG